VDRGGRGRPGAEVAGVREGGDLLPETVDFVAAQGIEPAVLRQLGATGANICEGVGEKSRNRRELENVTIAHVGRAQESGASLGSRVSAIPAGLHGGETAIDR